MLRIFILYCSFSKKINEHWVNLAGYIYDNDSQEVTNAPTDCTTFRNTTIVHFYTAPCTLPTSNKNFMITKVLHPAQAAGIELKILVSMDDSIGKKGKATKRLDAVDYHQNHTESTRKRPSRSNDYMWNCLSRSAPLAFWLTRCCNCGRRKFANSTARAPRKNGCAVAASTILRVTCFPEQLRICRISVRFLSFTPNFGETTIVHFLILQHKLTSKNLIEPF